VEGFDADRYIVDQPNGSVTSMYRVSPLATGAAPSGPAVAYVSEARPADGEDIRFFADEAETEDLFQIKARNTLDLGGSRCDVYAGERQIGALEHRHRASQVRSTWGIRDASNQELAVARERSLAMATVRHLAGFVPGLGGHGAMPSKLDLLIDGKVIGKLDGRLAERERCVLDMSGDHEHRLDRRLAIALVVGLDALQSR
jgi:hypothetical protein